MFYDYADSGSYTEGTYRANEADFAKIKLRQRVAVDISNRTLASSMVGQPVSMPVALAPTGLTGMQHADGEILAARAAAKAGVPFTLSTMSICSIEDVAENTDRPFWFQLYVMRDRDFIDRLIDRAKAAGCSALVLTVDLQILGQRHKDIKNGLSTPPRMTVPNIINLATKPRWCLAMLGTKRRTFRNIVGHAKGVGDLRSLSSWTAEQFDPALSWDDVKRIKVRWGGKLILKGILDPEDAELAEASGADALIVSNHGGRQLDGASRPSRRSRRSRQPSSTVSRSSWMGGSDPGRMSSRPWRSAPRASSSGVPSCTVSGLEGRPGSRSDSSPFGRSGRHHGPVRPGDATLVSAASWRHPGGECWQHLQPETVRARAV